MIYDPTLDNLYQKLVLEIEERETKHQGVFYLSPIFSIEKDLSCGKIR